jgi:hypothetical protein
MHSTLPVGELLTPSKIEGYCSREYPEIVMKRVPFARSIRAIGSEVSHYRFHSESGLEFSSSKAMFGRCLPPKAGIRQSDAADCYHRLTLGGSNQTSPDAPRCGLVRPLDQQINRRAAVKFQSHCAWAW